MICDKIVRCKEHQEEIRYICVKNHKCPDRRLCSICLDKEKDFIRVEKFEEVILAQVQNYQEQLPFPDYFKIIENLHRQTLEELKNRLQSAQQLDISGNMISQLKNELTTGKRFVQEYDQNYLNLMIYLYNNSGYIEKILKQKQQLTQIIECKMQEILAAYQSFFIQIEKLSSSVNDQGIEGPSLLGIKHGTFFNDKKEYVGTYHLNLKQGIWKEQQQGKFEFVIYEEGERKQVVQEYEGKIENEKREGWWLMKIGDSKQLTKLIHYENGIEEGNCEIFFEGVKCGGGSYNYNGKKTGQWIEPNLNYNKKSKISSKSNYVDGILMGDCQIFENGVTIAEGQYENNQKIGRWLEYVKETDLIYAVHYEKDKWGQTNIYKPNKLNKNSKIDTGFSLPIEKGWVDELNLKIGEWIEQHETVGYFSQGYYEKGIRKGYWLIYKTLPQLDNKGYLYEKLKTFLEEKEEILVKPQQKIQFFSMLQPDVFSTPIIAELFGGRYNELGQKEGFWIEPFGNAEINTLHAGKYKANLKIGIWKVFRENKINQLRFCGKFKNLQVGGNQLKQLNKSESLYEEIECQEYGHDFATLQSQNTLTLKKIRINSFQGFSTKVSSQGRI